jgi:ketosteroid isomerase-like protein
VVTRFNACINARDADGLGRLMTDDHTFIDTAGAAVRGKDACLSAWRGFFEQFPDYRNTLVELRSSRSAVFARGFSSCSVPVLDGPALWSARVRGDRVAEWRVYEDAPAHRARLGFD